jgi:formate dehydrogenase alpha subunit (EC 1.2.1.2)
MSNAINEIDNTDLVFIFGYNPADSHPIVANHVIRAKQNGAKIIVCDPRKIETARIADMHVALKNGSNIALLNAMGHVIIEENLYDQAFVASRTKGLRVPENCRGLHPGIGRGYHRRQRAGDPPGRPVCMPERKPQPSCGAWA